MSVRVTAMRPCIPGLYWPVDEVCYMFADDAGELHGMARAIGIFPFNFEDGPSPRYNLIRMMRDVALRIGAVEITDEEYSEMLAARSATLLYSETTGG